MAAQPVTITETAMRTVLDAGKRQPSYDTTREGQLVATWEVLRNGAPTGLQVKVYTSCFGGVSRGVGEDSIRVAVIDVSDPDGKRGVGKTTYTCRTVGWEKRVVDKIRSMFEFAGAIPRCPACGKFMSQRKSANGAFMGCTGFPVCKRTMPVPTALQGVSR